MPTPTFRECLTRYVRSNGHRAINKTDRCLAAKLDEFIGHRTLDEVTPKLLSEMRDKLVLRGYSNQTVKHTLGLVSRVYTAAERDWFVYDGENPVRRVRKPSVAHTGRTRVLTPEELERIVARLERPHAAFVMVAYETGMRRGEIARIRAEDFHKERRVLHIPRTKTGVPRTIPLSKAAVLWVERLLVGPVPDGPAASRAFRYAADRLRIRGVRFHDLRHTAITGFFEKHNLSVVEAAAISGHKTVAMLSRYCHLSPERLAARLD